jgi:3-deoxy-manno-octulosonate cytidylyltransferase (CMP-KDO synthetase)
MKAKQRSAAIVAIIPARFASTRFPGKPLANLNGKTLLQRTYENAKRCKELDRIIIATDHPGILDHAKTFQAEAIMTPVSCATGSDRLAFVLDQMKELEEAAVILNIQGDEPFLDPAVVEEVCSLLIHDEEAVMATAAYPIDSYSEAANPNCVKCVIDKFNNALYFSRSLIPGGHAAFNPSTTYYKHLGLYAFRPAFLKTYASLPKTPLQIAEDLEQLKVLEHGYKIKVAIAKSCSLDINTPEDLKKVELHLCKQNLSSSQAGSVPH